MAFLRRALILALLPILAFAILFTGCQPAGMQTKDIALAAEPGRFLRGCAEGLLAASAWECLSSGLRPAGEVRP